MLAAKLIDNGFEIILTTSTEDLRKVLSKDYDIVCLIDLASINQSHTKIYKIFSEHFQESFGPNQRLVFYSEHCPSQQLLDHIERAARLIDIDLFFILIYAPEVTHPLLKCINRPVKSSPLLPDQLLDETNLCPLPWMHAAISGVGDLRQCCMNKTFLGTVQTQKISTVLNSPASVALKEEFLKGSKPSDCSRCWEIESHGLRSIRQDALKFYGKKFFTEWLDDIKLRSVDMKLGNVCNFKCRNCNPQGSSLIASEQLKHADTESKIIQLRSTITRGRWFEDTIEFINDFEEVIPDLENIELYGGEPLLMKQLPKLLQNIIDTDRAKDIRIHFNTNGSLYPTETINMLKQFRSVDIGISIDNIGKRFELERGGSWASVEKNVLQLLDQANDQFVVYIFTTVSIQNVLYLDQLINWANKIGIKVVFSYLSDPRPFNIDLMTSHAKELVINRYQNHKHPELQKIAQQVLISPGSDGKEFVRLVEDFDKKRNQDFLTTHKEIAIAMGYPV